MESISEHGAVVRFSQATLTASGEFNENRCQFEYFKALEFQSPAGSYQGFRGVRLRSIKKGNVAFDHFLKQSQGFIGARKESRISSILDILSQAIFQTSN